MREITEPPDLSNGLILGWSGGKDSGAMAAALKTAGIPYQAVCSDTGWEAEEWYDHFDNMVPRVPGGIIMIKANIVLPPEVVPLAEWVEELLPERARPSGMVRLLLKKASFPSSQNRWCSTFLKGEPLDEWVSENVPDAVQATGIRREESLKREAMEPIELHRKSGRLHWRPVLFWTLADVLDAHRYVGWPLCPVYDRGPERVGCWPCIPARAKLELRAVGTDLKRVACIRRLEEAVSIVRKTRGMPGEDCEEGRAGAFIIYDPLVHDTKVRTIDQVLEWARTERGGATDGLVPAAS